MMHTATQQHCLRSNARYRLFALVVFLLSACANPAPAARTLDATTAFTGATLAELPQQATYRIGINTEVTGSGAQIGDLSIRAARLAVEEINAAGGVNGIPLELVVRDCRSNLATALDQYQQAVADDNLVALLGPVKSAYAVPMVQAHMQHALPLFIGATNTTLTAQGDVNLFRMRPSIRVTAAAMVSLALDTLGARHVAIIYDTDSHGTNGAEYLEAELARYGIAPQVSRGYATSTSDFDPIVRQVSAAQADTIFVYGTNTTDIGRLLRAVRYRSRDATIITSPGGSSAVTYNLAGDAQDGVYAAIDSVFASSVEGRHFESAFRARFGLPPDTYIAWHYDAVYVIANTLREQPNPAKLSTAIRTTTYQGAQGMYHFDATGEGLNTVALVQMAGGRPQQIGSYAAGHFTAIAPLAEAAR